MGKKASQKEQSPPPTSKDGKPATSTTSKSNMLKSELLVVLLGVVIAILGGMLYYTKNKNSTVPPLGEPVQPEEEIDTFADSFAESLSSVPKGANSEGKPREAVKNCLDRHEQCKGFKDNGECLKNPGWMIINCPKSCDPITNACTLRDPKIRCARQNLNISTEPIYQPGDMDAMFSNLEKKWKKKYNVQILSHDPWVALFENFIAEDEMKALVSTIPKFERSTDSGQMNDYGEVGRILSTGRTSSNGWCGADCLKHPKVKNIMKRIEDVTGVPRQNYESFQVLKYDLGQKYNVHHDASEDDKYLSCGPRILTFFLYLSDVEEGGETAFPKLGIAVKPKKGQAILWPSVMNNDPEAIDRRTDHEAKPVIKGLKVAANAWIHLYNYEKSNLWGCTGAFDEL